MSEPSLEDEIKALPFRLSDLKEELVKRKDVLAVLRQHEATQNKQVQAFEKRIEDELKGNTIMLRSDDPKSERRISVLHARIEMLSWVKKLIGELLKP